VATPAVYTYLAGNAVSPNPSGIAGYSVDPNSGKVTAVQGSPFNLTTDPVTDLVVAYEGGGTFLYAVTASTDTATTLLSFHISPTTGALTPIQTIKYPSGFGEPRLAVHPSGKFLYAAQVADCVLAYSIDPATGNLTQASCSSQNPNGPLVVAPSGKFAYGGDSNSSSSPILLTACSVNQSDGSLTSFQSVVTDDANSLLYTDPQGHALYNLTTPPQGLGCGGLSIWEIDATSGSLSSLNPSTGGPCTPWSMSFDPGGKYAYLTINIYHPYNGVYIAAVDPNTGNLAFVMGPSAAGSTPYLAAVEPSQGKFLLVHGYEYDAGPSYVESVLAYSIDLSTGAISPMSVSSASVPVANVVRMVIVGAVN